MENIQVEGILFNVQYTNADMDFFFLILGAHIDPRNVKKKSYQIFPCKTI